MKFTISIPRESCTNAKAKYSSSVVPPDPSVHFYHCQYLTSPCYKILAAPLLCGTSCTTNPQQNEIEWSYSITVGANENTCVRPRRVDCRKCGQQARPSTSFVDNTVDMPLQRKVQSLGQSSSRPGSVLMFASTRNMCRLCRRALQPRLRKFNQHYK